VEAVTGAILDELRRTALELAAAPILVFLPVEGEITLSDTRPSPKDRFFFLNCRNRGIQAIDLRPVFQAWLKRVKDIGHWDPLEHRIAAEGIRDALIGTVSRLTAGSSLPILPSGESVVAARRGEPVP
jgi:hypothetical protein